MTQHDDDEPLDPKVEAIRQKMVRLLMVSGGIMMLGLMAVLLAIVYKINSDKAALPVIAKENVLKVPAGSKVVSSSTSNDTVLVTLVQADGTTRIQLHANDGTLLSAYTVSEE